MKFTKPRVKQLYYPGMKKTMKSLIRIVDPPTRTGSDNLSYECETHYLRAAHFVSRFRTYCSIEGNSD